MKKYIVQAGNEYLCHGEGWSLTSDPERAKVFDSIASTAPAISWYLETVTGNYNALSVIIRAQL